MKYTIFPLVALAFGAQVMAQLQVCQLQPIRRGSSLMPTWSVDPDRRGQRAETNIPPKARVGRKLAAREFALVCAVQLSKASV